jgi:hypothetical protein
MSRWMFWRLWLNRLTSKLWSTEVDTFLALAVKSGLINVGDFNEVRADIDAGLPTEGALDTVCTHLSAKGILTKWQCEKLRQGKWKGFFLDGYCFLDQIGKGMTTSTYLCKEVATGRRVAMAVTPINLAPQDGRIHYVVKELPDESASRET